MTWPVPPAATHFPSELKAIVWIRSCGYETPKISRPVFGSHSLTSPLLLPEASRRLSGLKATDLTQPVCPESFGISLPVAICQRRMDRSLVPEANQRPSPLNATAKKPAAWLSSVLDRRPLDVFLSSRSRLPMLVAAVVVSGLRQANTSSSTSMSTEAELSSVPVVALVVT